MEGSVSMKFAGVGRYKCLQTVERRGAGYIGVGGGVEERLLW